MGPPIKRRLHAIYVQHTDRRQAGGLAALARVHERAFADLELAIVVVDNSLAATVRRDIAPSVTLIGGDNASREFSGWDAGWRFAEGHSHPAPAEEHSHPPPAEAHSHPAPDDVVLIANETFPDDAEAADFYALHPARILEWLARDQLVGHVDGFALPMRVLGKPMRRWVRTNFVLMNASVMRTLSPLAIARPDAELFDDDPRTFFRPGAEFSAAYSDFIKGFLQGTPNTVLWRWHSAAPFDAGNQAMFRSKARAIISEHALSARAIAHGFTLRDLSRPRFPSKAARHAIRYLLYVSGAWRLVPRFRRRFL